MRVIGLAGWSGAGKTTLVTRVIPHFLQQGLRVSVMEVGDQVEITERVEQRIVFLIEKAAGLMAGFGVKLWFIIQNVGQLKQHYKEGWETFFANCGVVTSFGVSDFETLKALSENLGRMGLVEKVRSGASNSALSQGASPLQDDRREVPLLAEHELRLAFGRKKNRVLIFNAEDNPAVAERFFYFRDPMFQGLYDPDPKYAATPGGRA